jgi:hypothetical protein
VQGPLPYKFNEPRRHKIPTAKYRVTHWPDYDAALVRRGALRAWFADEAVAEWRAPATGRRGGQPIYSALAIETALTIRLVFHQPLWQTEGLPRSIADVLDIAIPDHTTLSRRGVGLIVLPRDIHRAEPLHLVVDSTGLKIYGEGEGPDAKRSSRSRRRWRKAHIGINAETHDVVVAELTPDDLGDVSAVPNLLEQIDSRVASLTADGAYGVEAVYDAVTGRHAGAAVIIAPRATAVANEVALSQRDQHIAMIAQHGRIGWQRQSGYNRRSPIETAMVDNSVLGACPISAPRPRSHAMRLIE